MEFSASSTPWESPDAPAARARRSRGSVRAADRALQILGVFTSAERVEWSLEEIAARAELPKSTTHRLLETLIGQAFVEYGSRSGSYRLGLRAAVVGHMAMRTRRPPADVQTLLASAADRIGDGVGLSVLERDQVVMVARALSARPLQWNLGVGAAFSAHSSAAGKVLLAALSDDEIRQRFGGASELPRRTTRTVASIDQLLAQVRRVRERQFAVDDQELEEGLRCVAVPVCGRAGPQTHALGVSAPTARLSPDDLVRLVGRLRQVAAAMSPHITLVARDA
jgi:IclR family acetate operon transcriptional repressor